MQKMINDKHSEKDFRFSKLDSYIGSRMLRENTLDIYIGYGLNDLEQPDEMPAFLLAPIAGILMAGATASTTAGATIGAQTFAGTLIKSGVSALSAGAMVHAGATVIDSLPHGSFFHATGGAAGLEIKERMKLIPYEM